MGFSILLTNDDGYWAPGIVALHRELSRKHDVTVVAPSSHMSAIGHAITILRPLRYQRLPDELNMRGFWVDGTPADCVKLALSDLLDGPPEVVVSGMNLGENTGISAFYSGTLAGAREGAIRRLPSVAFSMSLQMRDHLDTFAEQAAEIFDRLLATAAPDGTNPRSVLHNVNFPKCPPGEAKGIRVTRQSTAPFDDAFERRFDDCHGPGMWLAGGRGELEASLDFDSKAHAEGYTTITPLGLDTTHSTAHEDLQGFA